MRIRVFEKDKVYKNENPRSSEHGIRVQKTLVHFKEGTVKIENIILCVNKY